MNTRWHILYYESTNGQCPIQEFIDGRKERDQAKVLSWISLLEDQGPNLPRPYADLLTDGIHELRIKLSGDQVRALYFFFLQRVYRFNSCIHQKYGSCSSKPDPSSTENAC